MNDSKNMSYFILFLFLVINFTDLIAAQQPELQFKECAGKGNYSDNSIYQTNLNNLFTRIYTNTEINFGFYNFTYGEDPDKVYIIALCRPDFTPEYCRSCLKYVGDSLLTLCPSFKESIGGTDDCMIRYSFRSTFRFPEFRPHFFVYGERNVSDDDVTGFNLSRSTLLQRLWNQAAAGDSRHKFAAGEIGREIQTIYGLVQCTPDLTASDCRNCLYNAWGLIPQCCVNRTGGRVILPSCYVRYEIDPFVNQIASPSPPAISPGNRSKRSRTVIIVAAAVAVSAIILAVSICIFIRTRKKKDEFQPVDSEIQEVESLQFDLVTIRAATDDFSETKKLGEGGFGVVYMGTLPNGQEIAVKRLARGSGQGELEFKNEVVLVAKLQHRNLVKLLGFCLEGQERLLVYEFLPNSSLNNFIFDQVKRENLNWKTRYKIIRGIARGLVYLHEDSRLRIIHRDLKASNILLDEEMNPKISDFGTARIFAVDQTQDDTSRIVGTFGYMAPEYIRRGHFSTKSDVFSFGVLILEIVSG
ncbi:cysteine-rich receptor-like protein kinase 10 [Euphorbia lathyris]|uniref:cysteine-rich receptor-like protein kinase 10 n=1 Tax=Euphorbia lathyris TaxID=212925 RepID=UPI0033130AA7